LAAFCENATQRPKGTFRKSAMPIRHWQSAISVLTNSPHLPLISRPKSLHRSRLSRKLASAGKEPRLSHTRRLVPLLTALGGDEHNLLNA